MGKRGEKPAWEAFWMVDSQKSYLHEEIAEAVLHKVLYRTNYNWAPEFYVISKTYSLIIAAINFSGVPPSEH